MRIAFFLAIAFFLFLLWRERRGDIEAWSDLSRRTFYGAIVLAVVAIGALLGLHPAGADAIAFFAVSPAAGWRSGASGAASTAMASRSGDDSS